MGQDTVVFIITYGICVLFPSSPHVWTIYLCRCERLPGACLCQGARHPPALPTPVASQSIPVNQRGFKPAPHFSADTRFPSVPLFSVRNSWRGAIGYAISFKYSQCLQSSMSCFIDSWICQESPVLFLFPPKSLRIFFLNMCFHGRLSRQRMTGPGISMLTQPFSF